MIRETKEALGIFERNGQVKGQAQCWNDLASLLFGDGQLNAAEKAAFRAIDLLTEKGQELLVCDPHQILGMIYRRKDEKNKAVRHFETTLGIVSPFNNHDELFWIHHDLADLFYDKGEFDDAYYAHIERANSHAVDDAYKRGRVVKIQHQVRFFPHGPRPIHFSYQPQTSPQHPQRDSDVLSTLDVFIQALSVAKGTCDIPLAHVAFSSTSALLTIIRVLFHPPTPR